MKTIFKGSPFGIVWNIIDRITEQPFDFTGMNVEVGLYSNSCKKVIDSYTIANGTITATIKADELQSGVYGLMCRYSNGEEQAYCTYRNAFQITVRTCNCNNTETIELTSIASHIDPTNEEDLDDEGKLIAEELFKVPFRLPELTADRAIADEHGNRIPDTYVTRSAVAEHIRQTYNQQFLENPPLITKGYITPEMLSEETRQMLEATGQEITNLSDGEDISTINSVLKFANKEYNPGAYSGMGRVYLRKNIVAGQNVLTQSMIDKPNTIYIIQYDYDLQGAEITIPENCVLDFQGGRFSNGVLIGNNTTVLSENSCFSNVSFQGKFCGETKVKWFDIHYTSVYDNSKEICNAFELAKLANKKIIFPSGIIYIDAHLPNSQQYCGYEGKIQLFDNCHIVLQNNTYIKVIPNDYRAYCVFTIANVKCCIIEGGNIIGDIDEHLGTSGEWGYGIGIFGSSNICIRNINISNCWGDGIIFDSFKDKNSQSSFEDIVNTNATVSNVHIKSCRRNNIAIGAVDGVLIENSTFENCGGSKPLYIEGEDWYYASNIDLEADIAGYHKIHNVTFRNITTKVQRRGNSKDRFADIQCQQSINKETGRMNASHIKYENIRCEGIKLSGYNTSVINSTITDVIDINSAVGFNVSNCQLIGDVIIEGNPNSENGNITNCILNKYINWAQANNKVNVTYCDFVIDDSNGFIGCYLSADTFPVLSHCKFTNIGDSNYTPSCFLHLTFEDCKFINFANVYGTFKYGDILKVVYKSTSDISISLIDSNTPTVVGRRRINIVDNSFEMSRTGDLFTNKDTDYFVTYNVFPIYREFINSAENKNTLKVYFGALKDCSVSDKYITLELLGNEFKVDVVERDTSKYNATYTEGKIENINNIPLIDDYRDKFSYNYKSIVHLFYENAHIKINPALKRVVEGTIWVQSISNLPSFSDAVKSYMRGLLSYVLDNNCTYRWAGEKWVDATGAEV